MFRSAGFGGDQGSGLLRASADIPFQSSTYRVERANVQHDKSNVIELTPEKWSHVPQQALVRLKRRLDNHYAFYPVNFISNHSRVMRLTKTQSDVFELTQGGNAFVRVYDVSQMSHQPAEKVVFYINQFESTRLKELDINKVQHYLAEYLKNYPLCVDQLLKLIYKQDNMTARITLDVMSVNGDSDNHDHPIIYDFSSDTRIELILPENMKKVAITGQQALATHDSVVVQAESAVAKSPRAPSAAISSVDDFLSVMGQEIGGHQEALRKIYNDCFLLRALPHEMVEEYGVAPQKGMLLYGPPGTGKTLIAREIGKLFSANIKTVNGSELKAPLAGESGYNVRKVFADAEYDWQTKKDPNDLHIIIIDEIDALCPSRSLYSGGSGVTQDIVSQFLTKLDGVTALPNVLVIGLTNRMDIIDTALLRPGRLGLHIEINALDKEARLAVLKVKTRKMRDKNHLGRDVNLNLIAEMTEGFSGAELTEVVSKAVKKAFSMWPGLFGGASVSGAPPLVKQQHFEQALSECQQAKTNLNGCRK